MADIGKIKIHHDRSNHYKDGEVVDLWDFFAMSKKECTNDRFAYLERIPIPSAVEQITSELGIEYKFV